MRSGIYEVFIPAPGDSMREDAFQWHITTRNFFAFVLGRPMVGTHLGKAMVDLQERLHLFRSSSCNDHETTMNYFQNLGYLDFGHAPDHALATLYFAEHYQLEELWIDAFAHCVGMNDVLADSMEFDSEGTTAGRLSVEYTLSGSSPSHGHNAQVDHVPDDDDGHPWEAAKSVKSSETLSRSLHEGNGIEQEPSHDIPPQEGGASSCVSSSEVAGSTHSSSRFLHDPLHNGLERPNEQSKADLVPTSGSTSAAEVNT